MRDQLQSNRAEVIITQHVIRELLVWCGLVYWTREEL